MLKSLSEARRTRTVMMSSAKSGMSEGCEMYSRARYDRSMDCEDGWVHREIYREVVSVKIPQALHEDFVLLGHSRCLYKGLRDALVFRGLIKVEEDVVEDGVFVMHRHVGFADLLVQLLQRIVGLGRVNLSYEKNQRMRPYCIHVRAYLW